MWMKTAMRDAGLWLRSHQAQSCFCSGSVYTSDDKALGYVTRFKNETIARLMDCGKVFHAYVMAREAYRSRAGTENYTLPFSIYMEDLWQKFL